MTDEPKSSLRQLGSRLVSRGGRLTTWSVIAILFLAFAGYYGFPSFSSFVKDYIYFDPDAEGVIIVDTPQLFTRERLLNDRLLESEWIDDQIGRVDDKLKAGEFGKPNTIELTELLLKLRLGTASNSHNNQEEEEKTNSTPQRNGDDASAREAYQFLKEANGLSPSPRAAFEAAWDFRGRLSQQRYETILDDAHDLGENTLHRLNFHLTVVPTRASTDSLAAVSVRMSETFDSKQVMESYSRLMIEVRKKMQDLVEQVFLDRSLIFDNNVDYRLDRTEETIFNDIIQKIVNNDPSINKEDYFPPEMHPYKAQILSDELNIYINARRGKIEESLLRVIRNKDPSGFLERTFSKGDTLQRAARKIESDCRQPYTLVDLIGGSSTLDSVSALDSVRKHIADLKQRISKIELASPMAAGTRNTSPSPDQQRIQQLIDELRPIDAMLTKEPIGVKCWETRNADLVSRLRLLGIVYHLNRSGTLRCKPSEETIKLVVDIVLGTSVVEPPPKYGRCWRLIEAADHMRSQLKVTGAEVGLTGLAEVLQQFLAMRLVETTFRKETLGRFFEFSISGCEIEHCQVRVLTRSESMAEEEATSEKSKNATDEANVAEVKYTASKAGQWEALRLFLELSCFASMRSYTVWPRAGERDTIVDAERKTTGGSFDDLLGTKSEARANQAKARRSDRDHIFGIGDWDSRESDEANERESDEANAPESSKKEEHCTPELMAVLANYEVDEIDFVDWIKNKRVEYSVLDDWWHDYIIWGCKELQKVEELKPGDCEGDINIQTLAAIAVFLRAKTTSVGWIVSPRTDGSGGQSYQKALSQPLSALVSLPSWWGRLNIEVTTCWVRPQKLRGNLAPGSLCENQEGSHTHEIELPLPSKAQEVLQKLGFFIIRTPYLDITQRDNREPVEAGRTAKIRLVGGRLWKNPRVRLGSQWHDRIEVLPNMQGLIATFDCVEPSTDYKKQIARFDAGRLMSFNDEDASRHGATGLQPADTPQDTLSEPRSVQVWTSEGVTLPQQLDVYAFRPRHAYQGEPERPCWLPGSKELDKAKPAGQ